MPPKNKVTDARKENRGKSCQSYDGNHLTDFLWKLNANNPENYDIKKPAKLSSDDIRRNIPESETWERGKIDFFARWHNVPKNDKCKIIQKEMDEQNKIYRLIL